MTPGRIGRGGLAGILTLVWIITGACSRTPSTPPLAPDAVVLAFGDSLTAGTGAEPDESYPAVLQNLIRRTVVNAGLPGELSGAGLLRLPTVVASVRPALVILCHGGNDFLQHMNPDETQQNLAHMIQFLQARNIAVVLIGVPQPTLLHHTAPLYGELARQYNLPYEGRILDKIIAAPSLKSDPLHPNAQGYKKMAEAIAEWIIRP